MRQLRIICLVTSVFTALSLQAYAQNSTQPANYNKPSESDVSPQGHPVVALFQDGSPWGSGQNESILTARGISFQIYPSSRMADLDLTQFRKVILVSQQPDPFFTQVEANRSRFEDYVNQDGILEMHLANFGGSQAERTTFPFGIRVTPVFCSNSVSIADPSNPIVTMPNAITSGELQNWNCSSHGAILGADALGLTTVITNQEGPSGPATVEGPGGFCAGTLVVTDSPIEYMGSPNTRRFNENLLCFGLSGIGTCP
jgi:hypothetical protein